LVLPTVSAEIGVCFLAPRSVLGRHGRVSRTDVWRHSSPRVVPVSCAAGRAWAAHLWSCPFGSSARLPGATR